MHISQRLQKPRTSVFRTTIPSTLALLSLSFHPLAAQTSDDVVAKIKDEGLNRSQVMQTLSYLTDVIGPRLTGSPNLKRANEWTRDTMTKWGLQNAHLEAWGPFGRGWTLERFSAQIIEPQAIPLIAYPKAWSPGWKGVKTGEVIYVDATDEAGLEKWKGKLKGAIVLSSAPRPVLAHFESQGARWTDEQLQDMAEGKRPRSANPRAAQGNFPQFTAEQRAALQFQGRKTRFFYEEGVGLILDQARGDGGTLFVQQASMPPAPIPATPPSNATTPGAPANPPTSNATPGNGPGGGQGRRGGQGGPGGGTRRSPWDKDVKLVPQVSLASEHYNRLVRMIQQGEKLKMAIELDTRFYDKDLHAYNTVAEIPGSDLKDEVVMLGGHMDSWHSGTGATDNAAGVAVCMEAARILKALNLQPRRTIRVGLWSGEEQGLFGSRAYVAEHFAAYVPGSDGSRTLNKKPEYEKFAGYFNLDNGTGKIRGIYLQGNNNVRPIFEEWMKPFSDMGAKTITISNTGGTDHQSFDGIGLPGFQFIQDEIEYETRTHHSNQDVYDRIQADDMKQAAIIMATFVYNTAMRDEKLPRKTTVTR